MQKLSFDEWKILHTNVKFSDEIVAAMERLHQIDFMAEVDAVLRQEYDIYVKGMTNASL